MRLVIDEIINVEIEELKEFLLLQVGITDVKIKEKKPFLVLNNTRNNFEIY